MKKGKQIKQFWGTIFLIVSSGPELFVSLDNNDDKMLGDLSL